MAKCGRSAASYSLRQIWKSEASHASNTLPPYILDKREQLDSLP